MKNRKQGNNRRVTETTRALVAAVLIYISIGLSFLAAEPADANTSMSMAVQLKERLILRVRTGAEALASSGYNQASVTSQFRMDDNPVFIEVFARVGVDQGIQLQVEQIGDSDPLSGDIRGDVTWQATGAGFFNGTLLRNQSQIMGTWTGPGKREGMVVFHDSKSEEPDSDRTYSIHYSLFAL